MIIFTGVAGSGKSIQGRMLADAKGYPWLSTGEFLRMLVSGEKRRHMLEGKLLPDEDIIPIVDKIFNLIDINKEFVLDGFPRTRTQASWLYDVAMSADTGISYVFHLEAKKDTVRNRLLQRGRQDDHDDAIGERFDEYERTIKPILSFFKENNVPVVDVDAEQSVSVIHQEIMATVMQ